MGPARQQIDKATLDKLLRDKQPEGGTYNIWHNRYEGQRPDFSKKYEKAKFRCNPSRDTGTTVGSHNPNAFFCVYFAKGMCAQGAKCPMWHRVPTLDDVVETTVDCFGRDKHSDFRQDMGGVGGFSSIHHTLYVGRITNVTDEKIRRHFSTWGELERVHILRHKGVAFVTYKSRLSAEFAKEAMMCQSLDNKEVLNVRWATEKQLQEEGVADRVDVPEPKNKIDFEQTRVYRPQSGEQQQYESDMPAEFTSQKRTLEDSGLDEIKRQKRIEDLDPSFTAFQSTPAPPRPIPVAQQPLPHPHPSTQPHQASSPAQQKGIIPQNVLQNLKHLSGNRPLASPSTATPAKPAPAAAASLGLADYGSDSDSD
ncbi:hypothetical protein BC940DRAFT_264454 [Gongronella butleri]|nr:hypothetical protein BC940DRAFT_264454 [Gongronella butleri]